MFDFLNQKSVKFEDDRGFLELLYEKDGVILKRSRSKAGVFRGMHWQAPPFQQLKFIRVLSGRILDFVLDPLKEQKTLYYKEIGPQDQWVRIDSDLAHGFYALEDVDFEYWCFGEYHESAEKAYSIKDFLTTTLKLENVSMSGKDVNAEKITFLEAVCIK